MIRMFSVVLFSSLLFGCVTTEARNQETKVLPYREQSPAVHSQADQEGYHINSSWEYRIEITHAGSRSEGRIGHLLFNGTSINGYFDSVIIGERVFQFVFRDHLWDFGGYREIGNVPLQKISRAVLQADATCTGWFESGPAKDRSAIPDAWIWVVRDSRSWYLDPGKLKAFIDQFDLAKRDSLVLPDSEG